jgi:hypothetical protein
MTSYEETFGEWYEGQDEDAVAIQPQRANDPDALLAKLAAERGESVEQTRAQVDAIKAASAAAAAPKAQDYAKLDARLAAAQTDAEAIAALQQAGFTTTHDIPVRPVSVPADIRAAHAYLETATSLEDYEAKLAEVGLLDRSSKIAW